MSKHYITFEELLSVPILLGRDDLSPEHHDELQMIGRDLQRRIWTTWNQLRKELAMLIDDTSSEQINEISHALNQMTTIGPLGNRGAICHFLVHILPSMDRRIGVENQPSKQPGIARTLVKEIFEPSLKLDMDGCLPEEPCSEFEWPAICEKLITMHRQLNPQANQ